MAMGMVMVMIVMSSLDRTVRRVDVIMMVRVWRKGLAGRFAEEGDESAVTPHVRRLAGTADVPVQAVDAVRGGHHDVQVVRDQKHAAPGPRPLPGDDLVDLQGARRVHILGRFVQDQEIGFAQ